MRRNSGCGKHRGLCARAHIRPDRHKLGPSVAWPDRPGRVACRVSAPPCRKNGLTDRVPARTLVAMVAPRYCDLVMKGGITSGVVYPSAVVELSQVYHFRSIGGTSAGAIAAAATAAAELGRNRVGAGFERMPELSKWLRDEGHLFDLFAPQRAARPLFAVALAFVGHESLFHRGLRGLGNALRYFLPWALLGAAPGLALAWQVILLATGITSVLLGLLALAFAGLGAVVGLATGLCVRACRVIPANGFGLSRGYDPSESPARPGLTSWLDMELDQLAGRVGAQEPLTFGELWQAWGATDPAPRAGERRINLQMITTCLTHGRPYRLPFTEGRFFFDPVEFGHYFPPRIVQHCVAHANGAATQSADGRTIYPLPEASDLPVVVAVRLSLSFPILISAVPLCAVDGGRPRDQRRPPERCWFSDGGISINLPVHFFDSPLPRWPTFAINLRPFTAAYPRATVEADNVWMSEVAREGAAEWWTRIETEPVSERPCSAGRQLLNFIGAILDTTRNWHDNAQLHVPGYRDRVVHVKLDNRTEGGLNLRMEPEVIDHLVQRGAAAGRLLKKRYAEPPPTPNAVSWLAHRWTRYRTTMALVQNMLEALARGYRYTDAETPPLSSLIDRGDDRVPDAYEWTEHQRRGNPRQGTEALLAVEEAWQIAGLEFEPHTPKPQPDLRITPRV